MTHQESPLPFDSANPAFSMTQRLEAEQILHTDALENKEVVKYNPDLQREIKAAQERALGRPNHVQKLLFAGPTGTTKTTLATNWAAAMEEDPDFATQIQQIKGNPDAAFVGLHLPLSSLIGEIAWQLTQETGHPITSADVVRSYREVMSKRISGMYRRVNDAAQLALSADPNYVFGLFLDSVFVTDTEDLGTSYLRLMSTDKDAHVVFPLPDEDNEERTFTVREGAQQEAAGNSRLFTSLADQENLDISGVSAQTFAYHGGTRAAWQSHWRDIYEQLVRNPDSARSFRLGNDHHQLPSLEEFMRDFNLRRRVYAEWVIERAQELGYDTEEVSVVENPNIIPLLRATQNTFRLHTHLDRMYGPQSRMFPYQLLRFGHTPTREELYKALGLKEEVKQ